jgi:NAD(P)-dependent dehydrogenase (short-subunit alcohol dehydrogenase family)
MDFFTKTMDVNAKGTFSFSRHFIQGILSPNNKQEPPAGGYAIVWVGLTLKAVEEDDSKMLTLFFFALSNIGSSASTMGLANSSAYVRVASHSVNLVSCAHEPEIACASQCASKHAVLGFSRAMAIEYAQKNIRVNVVAPGPPTLSLPALISSPHLTMPGHSLTTQVQSTPRSSMTCSPAI